MKAAAAALEAGRGNQDAALDWLLSHPELCEAEEEEVEVHEVEVVVSSPKKNDQFSVFSFCFFLNLLRHRFPCLVNFLCFHLCTITQ